MAHSYVPKYAFWTAFNATQAAFVAPLMTMAPPALLARAGIYTVAMMSSIAFVGATAKQEKYLYIGGPLLAGAAIVAVSGLAPLVVPATAVRTLAITENLWLWGGLAVFGGFTLYDVQKVLHHARLAERGIMKRDPVNESISLELDFLNIWVRMVQICEFLTCPPCGYGQGLTFCSDDAAEEEVEGGCEELGMMAGGIHEVTVVSVEC